MAVFADRGITDLFGQVQECVDLLADLPSAPNSSTSCGCSTRRSTSLSIVRKFRQTCFGTPSCLASSTRSQANLYRDAALNLLGVAEKVKALIDNHISARGVDPKIPPTAITDAEFEKVLQAQTSSRAKAAQMQHAARYHIIGFANSNPAFARKMSEKLEEILQRFKDDWDALERELRQFIDELRRGDTADFPDLDPKVQVPFVRLVLETCLSEGNQDPDRRKAAISVALEIVDRARQEVRKIGFWKNASMRELLTRQFVRDLDRSGVCPSGKARDIAQRLVALAKENHESLVQG